MDKGHEDCIATNWLARYNMAIYRFGAASDKYTGTQFVFLFYRKKSSMRGSERQIHRYSVYLLTNGQI